jgi:cobyrinic acid a,c-diamide synthase
VKGLVVAGTRSGVGKTVATQTVIRALQGTGRTVQPAKAGPDFIDPSHHGAVADRPSRTLDCWLEGEDGLRRNYHRGEGDVCVVEGVMGLYDGDASSTAMVAEALDLPVVLVVDGSAGMESVAATAHGFRDYAATAGRDIDVAGVVAQRTHGGRHGRGIREALPPELTFVGRIPPDDRLEIPDRHLGLYDAAEASVPTDALDDAAETIDADRLLDIAGEAVDAQTELDDTARGPTTVAVARDDAFRFVYPATIERLGGPDGIRTFSPVAGDSLPLADAVYLPGGYPELEAAALADSETVAALADAAAAGTPIFGECGGLMALSESLTTVDGDRYDMAGVLPAHVTMHDRYQALDHVQLRATAATPIAERDATLSGHEFHYSSATLDGDARLAFDVERGDGIADGRDGLLEYHTLGTYAHFHAASGAFDRLRRA